jgi:hypothetical protein
MLSMPPFTGQSTSAVIAYVSGTAAQRSKLNRLRFTMRGFYRSRGAA